MDVFVLKFHTNLFYTCRQKRNTSQHVVFFCPAPVIIGTGMMGDVVLQQYLLMDDSFERQLKIIDTSGPRVKYGLSTTADHRLKATVVGVYIPQIEKGR